MTVNTSLRFPQSLWQNFESGNLGSPEKFGHCPWMMITKRNHTSLRACMLQGAHLETSSGSLILSINRMDSSSLSFYSWLGRQYNEVLRQLQNLFFSQVGI